MFDEMAILAAYDISNQFFRINHAWKYVSYSDKILDDIL